MTPWLNAHPDITTLVACLLGIAVSLWTWWTARRVASEVAVATARRAVIRHAATVLALAAVSTLVALVVQGFSAGTGPLALVHGLPVFPLVDVVSLTTGTGPGTWTTLLTVGAGSLIARGTLTGAPPPPVNDPRGEGTLAQGMAPWAQSLLGSLALGTAGLVALATLYLPPLRAPGQAVVPGLLWGGGTGLVALLFALRDARGPVDSPPPDQRPKPRDTTRYAWEQRLADANITVRRQRYGPPAALVDQPLSPEDHGDIPLRSSLEAQLAAPNVDPVWRGAGLRPWFHQHQLTTAMVDYAGRHRSDVHLLDTGTSSGRTTAVLLGAQAVWARHRLRTIVLYPSDAHRNAAANHPITKRLDRLGLIGDDLAPPEHDPPPIAIVSVDDLVGTLADPERRERVLEHLGAVVVEDAEVLSGLRATNLSLLIRRLLRLLPDARSPACVVTTRAVRADRSGAAPYAQRLVAAPRVGLAGLADAAPIRDLHGYLLVSGGPHRDARDVDPLPASLQAALYTRIQGRPLWMQLDHGLTSEQRETPRWALQATGEDVPRPELAWVTLRSVRPGDALALPEIVAHGGSHTGYSDHLALVVPSMGGSAVVRWIVSAWLRSTDRLPDLGLFDGDLRELGSRLVCGTPSVDLAAAHLHAALVERPSTREEVRRALRLELDGEHLFEDALGRLLEQGKVRESTRRTLADRDPGAQGPDTVVEQRLLVGVAPHDHQLLTPLETSGGSTAVLLDVDAYPQQILGRIPTQLTGHLAYPGRVFVVAAFDEDTATVVHRSYQVQSGTVPGSGTRIPCRPYEGDVVTVPLRSRTMTIREDHASRQTIVPERGRGLIVQRVRVDLTTTHEGVLRYGEDAHGRRLDAVRVTDGEPRTTSGSAEAAVITLHASPLDRRGHAALEALLGQALQVLVQLEEPYADLVVGEPPHPAQTSEVRDGAPPPVPPGHSLTITLLDPLDGDAGTLDAILDDLGVVDLLRFTWLWLDDTLATGDAPTWSDLQTDLPREERGDGDPPLAEIREVLASVLGDEARRAEPLPPTPLPPAARERPLEDAASQAEGTCDACDAALGPGAAFVRWRSSPGLRFCTRCAHERPQCDFCALPAGPKPHVYGDGRDSCTRCLHTAVRTQPDLDDLLPEALDLLDRLGMRPSHPVRLTLVDAARLATLRNRTFRPTRRYDRRSIGLCLSSRPRLAGTAPPPGQQAEVYLEDGHPRVEALGTLIHELVHAWQWEVFPAHDVDLALVEGLAVWAEERTLSHLGHHDAARHESTRADAVYGGGYRRIAAIEAEVGEGVVAREVLRRLQTG